MQITIKNIPTKFEAMANDRKELISFYQRLSLVVSSADFSNQQAILPIIFYPKVENIGERFLFLSYDKLIGDEPVVVSLVSKKGEPMAMKDKRDAIATPLTRDLKQKFGKDTDVEIEFVTEFGIFIYINGEAIN